MRRMRIGSGSSSFSKASCAVSEKTNGGLSAAGDSPAAGGGSDFTLVPLSTLPQQAIRWCWPNRIPRGMVTVLAGYQKSGKTFVACKIAATITRGRKFPGSKRKARRGHVVMINNEDHAQQILRPRIAAAGGDRSLPPGSSPASARRRARIRPS
jgi:hypothetical protein